MEYLALLAQNGSLPPIPAPPTSTPATSTSTPQSVPPPTQGRSFSRPNRGTGGVLSEKQKVSKDITASATKRKSFVDPDAEVQAPSSSEVVATTSRQTKRPKVVKVRVS